MLLTITYNGTSTQDLGFLLFKHPGKVQRFELSYGNAYVFYPEVSKEQTTAALLLEIDPLDLAKGKAGSRDGGLFDYVNDRPYVSSSFMSTAIARVFGTAMNGRCDVRPELAAAPIDLTATIHTLPVRGDKSFVERVFSPLGYEVSYQTAVLDEQFPTWGESPYIDLTIHGKVRLAELLNHLYVLIPAFDGQKHYYTNREEIDKLLSHGEGWLSGHPERDRIVRRYFGRTRSYAWQAIDRLTEEDRAAEEETNEQTTEEAREEHLSLDKQRLAAVRDEAVKSGAASILDLGCGEGKLLALLMAEKQFSRIAGTDVSVQTLERAKRRLHTEKLPEMQRARLALFQGSAIYKDSRFRGYDAVCAVEVIEHIDPDRQAAFEHVLFGDAAPQTVILTTPNREYNANYEHLREGALRHDDHRFEWTRKEFADWAAKICECYGYTVELKGIGDRDDVLGTPTQMAVFTRDEVKKNED